MPEKLEALVGRGWEPMLARAAVKAFIADLLAREAGLTAEEAVWMEEQVKKGLAERKEGHSGRHEHHNKLSP
ncbi:MAG: hypothetical protein GSR81_01425 [Desulfurococcales archaeon]|nr:hypothetical protein [Desulfurococcales archaeon]